MRRDAKDTGRGEAETRQNNLTDARYEQLQAIESALDDLRADL